MKMPSTIDDISSLFGVIFRHLRNWRASRAGLAELDDSGGGEAQRIARDLGLSASELRTLFAKGPEAASLLRQRMEALNLSAVEMARTQPAVLRDLQRLCTMCEAQGRCARDLAQHKNSSAWREYCPNTQTLEALQGEKRAMSQ